MPRVATLLAAAVMTMALPVSAQVVDADLNDARLFGIDHDTAALRHYLFGTHAKSTVGTIAGDNGIAMTGIQAAGYFPGFGNLFALWQDPADGQNKLVYVGTDDAHATVMAADVEGGKFTGAAAVNNDQYAYTLFAVQQEVVQPPANINGLININPNNSADNEFYVDTPAGRLTRDTLHQGADIDSDGTIYEGPASTVFVKPKGNGKQNGVTMDGEAVSFKNSNTYTFAGEMVVRVYNDKPRAGKAMGHWWVEIVSGTAILNDEVEVLYPNRLTTVCHKTGDVTEVMRLSRAYHGLATRDGNTFYAQHDGVVYEIVPADETETALTDSGLNEAGDLEFIGSRLMGYDRDGGILADIDLTSNGGLQTTYGVMSLGLGQTDPIVFAPTGHIDNPTYVSALYD